MKNLEVKAHINKFPRYKSHYCRNRIETEYLNSELNLAKLYEMYKEGHQEPVGESTYKRIFYKHFNLKFKADSTIHVECVILL